MSGFASYGLVGLFFASFLAATVLPFSSEAVLAIMSTQSYDPIVLLTCASLGNWIGGITSYMLGYFAKWDWLVNWFKVSKSSLEQTAEKFNKFGIYAALLCWLPFIGDPIAVLLGLSRSNFLLVAIFMLIGKVLRYVVILWGIGLFAR